MSIGKYVSCCATYLLSIEEVKYDLITGDIKLVSYSSSITMIHGPIYIRQGNNSNKDMAVLTQLYYQEYITYQHQPHVSTNVAVAIIRLDTIYQRSYIDMI